MRPSSPRLRLRVSEKEVKWHTVGSLAAALDEPLIPLSAHCVKGRKDGLEVGRIPDALVGQQARQHRAVLDPEAGSGTVVGSAGLLGG